MCVSCAVWCGMVSRSGGGVLIGAMRIKTSSLRQRAPHGPRAFSHGRNTPEHTGKHQLVQRVNPVPVDKTEEAERVEDRGLASDSIRGVELCPRLPP